MIEKKFLKSINNILSDWNPIGVPDDIALDEYREYIPVILKYIEDRQQLINCLEDILVNKIGLDYHPENQVHFDDLQQLSDKLIRAYQNVRDIEQ